MPLFPETSFRAPIVLGFCLLLSSVAQAEDAEIAQLFSRHGIEGTLVISALGSGRSIVHNDARAAERFSSASTFKIFNSLIALEQGVIAGKDGTLKWDGQQHDLPDWNRDQTLASAFRVSCVWCYQQLASDIGAEAYRHYLSQAGYGQLAEPFELTTFWLDGSLQISAMEQVEFLQKVYRRSLPFRVESYDTLRDIMLVETAPGYRLFAKTGWAARSEPQVGWYVGYVETTEEVWVFASNIRINHASELPLRLQLTREALRLKGIMR